MIATSTMTKAVIATDIKINYKGHKTAIISDLRSPYVCCGIHPEWRRQFINAINNPAYHAIVGEKLSKFGNFIIFYTKIIPDKTDALKAVGFDDATVCVMSSVGEHNMTPWMIIHNIGHTVLSWNLWVKRDIKKILGLKGKKYRIAHRQKELVKCAAARNMIIPNINELIYELYTTWVWHGRTQSDNKELAEYCDKTFAGLMEKYKNRMFWHKYRCPKNGSTADVPWLKDLMHEINDGKPPMIPGIPGYSTKVLKIQNAD